MGLRRHARPVAADEAPQRLGVLGVRGRDQIEQHGERDRHVGAWRCTGMDVPHRVGEALLGVLALVAFEELLILVHVARDHVEIQPLRRLRLAVHEQRQALRARIAQPFLDREAVALGLGDFLALLVQEQFVIEALGRVAAKRAADFARQLHGIDQILAGHLVIDAERDPAHRPVGLPLQLAMPAGDRRGHPLARTGIVVGDGASGHVAGDDRHLQHLAGARRNGQERRIGAGPLGAQRRQHDGHDFVEPRQHGHQRRVEAPRRVIIGRGHEFVVEAEGVEERAQPRIVVSAEAAMGAERVRDPGQRLAEVRAPACPCSGRCPAPCAARPCRRRTRSAGCEPCRP